MNLSGRLRVPFTLVCALVLALVLAATASAETRTGETTSPVDESISGEADILGATAHYDSTTGAASFTVTTREPTKNEEKYVVEGEIGTPENGECRFEEETPQLPLVTIEGFYAEEPVNAFWDEYESNGELSGFGRARKSQSGATTSVSASSAELANQPYRCVRISMETQATTAEPETEILDEVIFTLTTVPPPPAPPAAVTPAPKPGFLSLGASKPLTLKVGKWGKVKVTLTNSGGTAISPVTLKAKAPAGVVVKPGSGMQSLPALLPGQSWTVGFSVKLTAKAKTKSTISLAGSAPGISGAASSVVVTKAPVVRPVVRPRGG